MASMFSFPIRQGHGIHLDMPRLVPELDLVGKLHYRGGVVAVSTATALVHVHLHFFIRVKVPVNNNIKPDGSVLKHHHLVFVLVY